MTLTNRIVLYLVRKQLGLKKNEPFQFANQKTDDIYAFTYFNIAKCVNGDESNIEPSGVSLNWLLDPECKVVTGEELVQRIINKRRF